MYKDVAPKARYRTEDAGSIRKDAEEKKEGRMEYLVPGLFGAEGRVGEVDDVAGSTGQI